MGGEEEPGLKTRIVELHDYKTLAGPCLISFSIPLLVPGVTLTLVGIFSDSEIFPLYGGWHITGIVFLSVAVVLLIAGIALRCVFKAYISPDVEKHLTPMPSFIGRANLAFEKEKGLETLNGVYKEPKGQTASASASDSHNAVSTKEGRSRSKRSDSDNLVGLNGVSKSRHYSRHDRTGQSEDIEVAGRSHEPSSRNRETRGIRSRDRSVSSGPESDKNYETNIQKRRSRTRGSRSRSLDRDSDGSLGYESSDRNGSSSKRTAIDAGSSGSGARPSDPAGQRVRRKKRTVSKAPSFGLEKQDNDVTRTESVETVGGVKTSVKTSVRADPGTIVHVTSGSQSAEDQGVTESTRPQQRRRRKRKKKRRQSPLGDVENGHEMTSLGHGGNTEGATGLPELRIKPALHDPSHHFDPSHHVGFQLQTNDPDQDYDSKQSDDSMLNQRTSYPQQIGSEDSEV